tara:strand:+ start:40 stop:243 length:204 start_codon:yes stop_codon:yes gene_type:complete
MKVGDLVKGKHGRSRMGIVFKKYRDPDMQTNDPKFKFLYSVMWNDQRHPTFFSEAKWHDLEVVSEGK